MERNAARTTRATVESLRSSPTPAGPSNVSSATVVPNEEATSVSAAAGLSRYVDLIRGAIETTHPQTLSSTYGTERRVTRQSARETRKSDTPEVLDELVLVFPPSGTGAVNITRGDLKRLDNGQYLNDTLIEFGLKVCLHSLPEELAEQVHIFNSFFFKKLNSKKEVKDSYPSVRKWTSKVDIFKKKYIIVPINEK
ncbi:hypothetical protein C8Q77DRAFT_1059961 [Trametes polyzona]|nr:hypothetical protein C8Q77DRAFT_1059961 [Trametes polyzona]